MEKVSPAEMDDKHISVAAGSPGKVKEDNVFLSKHEEASGRQGHILSCGLPI